MSEELKNIIKKEYKKRGMTIDQLSEKLNLSRQMLLYFIKKKNIPILKKLEILLELKEGFLTDKVIYAQLEDKKSKLNSEKEKTELILSELKKDITTIEFRQEDILKKSR